MIHESMNAATCLQCKALMDKLHQAAHRAPVSSISWKKARSLVLKGGKSQTPIPTSSDIPGAGHGPSTAGTSHSAEIGSEVMKASVAIKSPRLDTLSEEMSSLQDIPVFERHGTSGNDISQTPFPEWPSISALQTLNAKAIQDEFESELYMCVPCHFASVCLSTQLAMYHHAA